MKIDKFDRRFSEVIREAANWTCEICQRYSTIEMGVWKMECSHDRSRRFPLTRYDPRNAICSCSGCHRKTTEDHDYHVESFRKIKGGEVRQTMRDLSNSRGRLKKFEREDIYLHWANELKRIKALRANGITGKIELIIPETLL
jgi:hypothetical protein